MPKYSYECEECSHTWEERCRMGKSPKGCPSCTSLFFTKLPPTMTYVKSKRVDVVNLIDKSTEELKAQKDNFKRREL